MLPDSDRWLSLAILLSLIAAIVLRTILPRADDGEGLGFRGSFRFVVGDVIGALPDHDQLFAYHNRAGVRTEPGDTARAVGDRQAVVRLKPELITDSRNQGDAYSLAI